MWLGEMAEVRKHGDIKLCSRFYLSEETHSWEQGCVSVAGSRLRSYFCRRVEKYVFDYKHQKRKDVLGELTFTAGK